MPVPPGIALSRGSRFTRGPQERKIAATLADTCPAKGQGAAVNPTRIRTVARRLAAGPRDRGSPPPADADLLTRFLDRHDEAAFEDLVARHLPAVRAVCR